MIEHSYWYATRAAGIASYLLLTLSVTWGLLLSTRLGDRWLGKPLVYEAHRMASLVSVVFLGIHIASLLGDTYIEWDAKALFVPLDAEYRAAWVALGIVSAYAVIAVTASFYVRKWIGYRAWRLFHYVSFGTFVMASAHGLMTGSDSHEPWMLGIYATALVVTVFLVNLRLVGGAKEPRAPRPLPQGRALAAERAAGVDG